MAISFSTRRNSHGIMVAVLALLMALSTQPLKCAPLGRDTVATDSADFVKSSIVIVAPGRSVYSVFGHAALRMECPSADLDYCFTFEMESGVVGTAKFFFGQSEAGFVAVPTREFVDVYRREHRQVALYELNLSLSEKRELWRFLDEEIVDGRKRCFNMLRDNCVAMVMLKVESVMFRERFVCHDIPEPMSYSNGDGVKYLSRRSPWAQFLYLSLLGSEADDYWEFEQKLSPEMLPGILQASVIRNDSSATERPALIATSILLNGDTIDGDHPSPLSPLLVAVMLLVAVIMVTIAERWFRWRRVCLFVDGVLFVAQSVIGVLLLYATVVSGLFGSSWNWLLIPFNPLPLSLWLFCRKRCWYARCWWVYSAVLVFFLVVVPWLTCQLLAAHYVLTTSLLVRCVAHCTRTKISINS